MKTKLLGDFDIYINDGNYGEIYPEKEQFKLHGIPFISASDFSGRVFNYKGIKHIDEKLHFNVLTKGHLRKKDIVIVVRGNGIGKVGFFNDDIGECNLNAQLAFIRTNPAELDPLYLYYLLSSRTYYKLLKKFGSGSAQPQLPLNRLRLVPIIYQNIKEQQKIASVLSYLDAKIELNNKINAELEAMAKTLYDYWFVQFDFPNEQGKPYKSSGGKMVYNKELKREIPEGWRVLPLKSLVDLVKENISPKEINSKTPYIGLEHIPRKTMVLSEWETSEKVESDKLAFKKHDILFGKIRPYFHKVGIAFIEGITSTDTIVLRSKKNEFFGLAFETVFTERFVTIATKSSTGTKMPRANWNILKEYKIAIPNPDLLEKYQSKFGHKVLRIEKSVHQNKQLTELRDWLLPMLMNGQVTVGEVEEKLDMAAEAGVGYGK